MTDTIVVCHSKGREHCKLILGSDWEECYFIRQGDIRDTSCQLITSALNLLKLVPVLLHPATLLKSRMQRMLHEESAVYGRCRLLLMSFTGICYMELGIVILKEKMRLALGKKSDTKIPCHICMYLQNYVLFSFSPSPTLLQRGF